MAFFDFIKKYFAPSKWLDDKIKQISHRVDELRKPILQKPVKNDNFNVSVFDIRTISVFKVPKSFTPRSFVLNISMHSLRENRIELEKKRLKEIHEQVLLSFSSIKQLIDENNTDKAEHLLIETYSAVNELNDDGILNTYTKLLTDVKEIEEHIRQEEIERRRIEKENEEEARRKREVAEQEKKTKLEEERLRKEREAREYEERLRTETRKRENERKNLLESVTCKKPDADKFLDYLKRKGINCFYHFTDERNLVSIRKHGGLYSWYYCENNGIEIPNAGGNDLGRKLDCEHELQDYVRLSFCSDHPMQYRLQCDGAKLVLLRIKVDVAAFKDTQFSNMNAAANAVQHGATFKDLERVNIYAVKQRFVRKTDDIFHEHQAECMVKTFIPIEFITNIDNPQRL